MPPPRMAHPDRRMPAWVPFAAMIAAFLGASLAVGLLAAALDVGGYEGNVAEAPGLLIGGTLVQDALLVLAAVLAVRAYEHGVRPASFGLRRTPWARALGWIALTYGAFWLATAIFVAAVGPPEQQELVEEFENEDTLSVILGYGTLACVAAPIAEEFFFRGFMFPALARRLGWVWAALATGGVFGVIHISSSPIEAVAILVLFGVALCVLYWKTSSLLPCLALHAGHNSVTFAAAIDVPPWALALIVIGCTGGVLAVGASAMGWRPRG